MPQPKKPIIDIREVEKSDNGFMSASIDAQDGPVLLIPVEKK